MKQTPAGTYLGLPEWFSGFKVDMLNYLKDRLKARLSGWYSRTLSQGGKEILLKAVALSMPVYAMSCFKLPKTTCANLASAMARYWWNSLEHTSKIHWISWEKLCLSKDLGGLGFRDIELFNQALLAKQAWRILQEPECFLGRVLRSRYFRNSPFLDSAIGDRPSFGWRSLLFGRELLQLGIKKMIGNGKSMRVWTEKWIEDEIEGDRAPWIKNFLFDANLWISDLVDVENRCWHRDKLEELFVAGDVQRILSIRPVTTSDDFWRWRHNKNGCFSVKSAYWLACQHYRADIIAEASSLPSLNSLRSEVWSLTTEPKIKVFLWKVLNGSLPVDDRLRTRGMKTEGLCSLCGLEGESINHVLFSCAYARQLWALSGFPSPLSGFSESSIYQNFSYLLDSGKNQRIPPDTRRCFPWFLWNIWKNRNKFLFEGLCLSAVDTYLAGFGECDLWFHAQKSFREDQKEEEVEAAKIKQKWVPPEESYVKCNVGCAWSKRKKLCGASWVVRNKDGMVLLHSRYVFINIDSALDGHLKVLVWAIDCMRIHRFSNVIFALEERILVDAINRPRAWPSYRFVALECSVFLDLIPDWLVVLESPDSNRGSFLIAQSVLHEQNRQSYVAFGHPLWLDDIFASEKGVASD